MVDGESDELIFGDCVLRPAGRELLWRGQPQPLPPKAFELLLHLVRQRDRVVPKAELLDAVWRGADVSDNVLARTVMKVRQALGDTGDEPLLLRTVHRVGYRFQPPGGVSTAAPGDGPAAPEGPSPAAARPRLALLPVHNASGDSTLDWTAWGLPLLAAQALDGDTRLSILATETVQHALSQLPAARSAKPDEALALQLAELTGAQSVVLASLRRSGERLRLDYHSVGRHELRGSLKATEPGALGGQLADALAAGLFPETALRNTAQRATPDPLASQAFARAIEVGGQERWEVAARLLRVVLDFNPDDLYARLHHLRALANLNDAEAERIGLALVADAERAGDLRLTAAAHEGLGRALFNSAADAPGIARARQHLDTALALARPFDDEDWVIRIYLGQAIAAQVERDYERARRFYDLAWRANERAGNQLRRAVILTNHAVLSHHAGDLLVARDLAEQALALCERHGLRANSVDALACLALAEAGLGLFRQATARCEAAMARLAELPANEHDSAAWVLLIAAQLAFELRSPGDLAERAFHAAAHLGDGTLRRVLAALAVAWAYRAAHEGDLAGAEAHCQNALAQSQDNGYAESVHLFQRWRLGLWLRLRPAAELLAQKAAWQAAWHALPRWAEDLPLQAAERHARAAQAQEQGDDTQALALLAQTRQMAPLGSTRAHAQLDAAWLQLEAGQPAEAARLLRDIGPWLREHPLGLAAAARLALAQGRRDEAGELHQAAMEAMRHRSPPFLAALGPIYAATQDALAPPRAPRLLTLL